MYIETVSDYKDYLSSIHRAVTSLMYSGCPSEVCSYLSELIKGKTGNLEGSGKSCVENGKISCLPGNMPRTFLGAQRSGWR